MYCTLSGAIGCSDHDLLFSHEEVVDNTPEERQFVEERVSFCVNIYLECACFMSLQLYFCTKFEYIISNFQSFTAMT